MLDTLEMLLPFCEAPLFQFFYGVNKAIAADVIFNFFSY